MRGWRVVIVGVVVAAAALVAWCGRRSAGRGGPTDDRAATVTTADGGPPSTRARGAAGALAARAVGTATGDAGTAGAGADGADGADDADGGDGPRAPAIITRRVLLLSETLRALVIECYETAAARHPGLAGRFRMKVAMRGTPDHGNLIHEVTVDDAATSLRDPDFRECATENIFAAEELLEQLRAAGDPTGNRLVETIDLTFPLVAAPVDAWPAGDTSPACGPGQRLRGDRPPAGQRQWCEDAQGRKQGDEYLWGEGGEIDAILRYVDGRSNTMRMRPLDQAERADGGT